MVILPNTSGIILQMRKQRLNHVVSLTQGPSASTSVVAWYPGPSLTQIPFFPLHSLSPVPFSLKWILLQINFFVWHYVLSHSFAQSFLWFSSANTLHLNYSASTIYPHYSLCIVYFLLVSSHSLISCFFQMLMHPIPLPSTWEIPGPLRAQLS